MHSLNFPNFSKKLRVFLGIEALKLFSRSRKNDAQLLFQVKLRNAQHDFESSNFEIFVNGIYLVLCSFNQSFHWQVHFHSLKFEREKPRIRRQSFVYETLYVLVTWLSSKPRKYSFSIKLAIIKCQKQRYFVNISANNKMTWIVWITFEFQIFYFWINNPTL